MRARLVIGACCVLARFMSAGSGCDCEFEEGDEGDLCT